MDLSKACSSLNNTAQIDGTINNGGQIASTVNSSKQVDSTLTGLTTVRIAYTGGETDNIEVTVDSDEKKIYATNKQIQYESKLNFPNIGSEKLIYVDILESAIYRWDSNTLTYVCIGRDYTQIEIISGGNA